MLNIYLNRIQKPVNCKNIKTDVNLCLNGTYSCNVALQETLGNKTI